MALGGLLHITRWFVVPFVIAVFLSYLLIPLADWMVRMGVPPLLANVLVLVGVLVVLSGAVLVVYGGLSSVTSTLPKYMQKYDTYLKQLSRYLETYLHISVGEDYKSIKAAQIFNLVSPASMMKTVNRSIGAFLSFMSRLTLMMLFLTFILVSRRVFIDKFYQFLRAKKGESEEDLEVIQSIARQVQMYLGLKTLISIGTGLAFGLAAFFLGLDFAVIWGVVTSLCNFIPTIGPIIATIPAICLAAVQFDSLLWALFTSLVLSALQFTSGNFVEPLVMGNRLNLNIITILMSLLLWGMIWGIPGMILAVPITAALNIVCSNISSLRDFSILLSK